MKSESEKAWAKSLTHIVRGTPDIISVAGLLGIIQSETLTDSQTIFLQQIQKSFKIFY